MISRPDLLDERSPKGLEVFQIGEGPLATSHIYMEARVFTPDSRRFVLQQAGQTHGCDRANPDHGYLLCDLENGGAITQLTHGAGDIAPSVSPDGRWLYYLHDETVLEGGRLELRRVALDGGKPEVLHVSDTPLKDTGRFPSRMYPLTSIRSDGRKLATGAYFGDARWENEPFGLIVFDLETGEPEVIWAEETLSNPHPQYFRGTDPRFFRDILVQENHGVLTDPQGVVRGYTGGQGGDKLGPDIHVLRDDGENLRTLPWGRDGWVERCGGHQAWRGASEWVIGEITRWGHGDAHLMESRPLPFCGHVGKKCPGAERNRLTRSHPEGGFHHFATDESGRLLIMDTDPIPEGRFVQMARLGEPGRDALSDLTYLLRAGTSVKGYPAAVHPHPFFSPDGRTAFFNSDESGVLRAYMLRNLPLSAGGM